MFGQWQAIREASPYYFVDYQEQPEEFSGAVRWLDRVIPDGTWSGNLFDFYRKIIRKLMADLKVPFRLQGDIRQDEGHQLTLSDAVEPSEHTILQLLWGKLPPHDGVSDGVNDGANRRRLDELDQTLLDLVRQQADITQEQMAGKTGKSLSTIQRRIRKLRQTHLRRIGSDKSGHWEIIL